MTDTSEFIRESMVVRLFEIADHGTGIVLVDLGQQDAARAFLREVLVSEDMPVSLMGPGVASFVVSDTDPRTLEGTGRSRFEDGIFERSRRDDAPRVVYVTPGPAKLYVIPSVRKHAEVIDLRGLTFPTSPLANAASEAAMASAIGADRPIPSPGDTLWHQDEPAR